MYDACVCWSVDDYALGVFVLMVDVKDGTFHGFVRVNSILLHINAFVVYESNATSSPV